MASVAPQGELLERGTRARLLARQAVGELTRELKETEGRLRQLEYEERLPSANGKALAQGNGP